jgi:hypothetical protein
MDSAYLRKILSICRNTRNITYRKSAIAVIDTRAALNYFGANLKALRLKRGLQLGGVGGAADLCGINREHLAKIEAGTQHVRLDTMLRIAEGFGVPLATLVTGLEFDAFHASHASGQDAEWYAMI